MDRNSAIGLTLIAALLLVYFYWFAPQPQPPVQKPTVTESSTTTPADSATTKTTPDSAQIAAFGGLATFIQGSESTKTITTNDLRIVFSTKGGIIKELELLNYKTYDQKPLMLMAHDRTKLQLQTTWQGKDVNLYSLFYQVEEQKVGDSTVINFSLPLGEGNFFTQTYVIPQEGFQIKYRITQKGFADKLNGDNLTLSWDDAIKPMEKDLQDTRINTSVSYYQPGDGFDILSERSTSTETTTFTEPVKWIAFKQKFFLASLIGENVNFSGGSVSTSVNTNDDSIVKFASAKLFIPRSALASSVNFKFYAGPNDYQIIGKVADEFAKNVYLGWPPVYWINKYVIFPVFHLLTQHITNYGLIIVILVILLKLVLFPLSYRSYLSMAKMRVLKPELDEIKEKHGDDMAKTQQEQMKLYQQVGVNPISGCIPVLLQMPILFAMFYLFPASIELRQQPFLWAEDLSTYDSLIKLPFTVPFLGSHISLFTTLMTLSTLIYTWQNNQLSAAQGPMKVMSYLMPLIFFFVLNSFSAGLTFYYLVSNLVTFSQQALIKRFVDEGKIRQVLDENRKKNAAGQGKKSKFMSRLEDAMKASEEARRKAEEERKKRKK